MCGSVWKLKMRGMKKILLAAVGAAGLLESCNTVDAVLSGYYGNANASSTVRLGQLTNYTTNNQLSVDATDQNGNKLAAGTYVICRNWDTVVNFDLNWSGYLSNVGFQLKGYNTGNYVNTGTYTVNSSAGSAPVSLPVGQGVAPLSINTQSVILVPKVTVLGYTYVRAQGRDANGYASNIVDTGYAIPVTECYNG